MKTASAPRSAHRSLAALFSAALTVGFLHAAEGSFERTLEVSGPVKLEVTTGSGDIRIRPGTDGTVEVRGKIRTRRDWFGGDRTAVEKVRALESNPPIHQNGNVIRIGQIEDRDLRRHLSISYELVVPVESRVRAETGSGDLSIVGVSGPVDAGSGSGNLSLSKIAQGVRVSTGSGTIQLDSVGVAVQAETGSGRIRARGVRGGFTAETGSGDIEVEQTGAGDVLIETGSGNAELTGIEGALRARTGSGDITVSGVPTGEWRLEAGSGNIALRLPAETGFELHAHTGSGRISTNLPITIQGTVSRKELRGMVRGGGVLLQVQTGSGNIQIQ